MWKKTALDLYLERSSSALPDPAGWFHRRLHKYPPSWRWKLFSYLNLARSCRLKLLCGLVAYAELAIELGIRSFSYVSKWTKSECPSLISMGTDLNKYWEYQNPKLPVHFLDVNPFTLDPSWSQICSFFTPFIKKLQKNAKRKGDQKQKDSFNALFSIITFCI